MISGFRILLVPVLLVLILARTRTTAYVAAAIFLVGALSDGVDGYLARRYKTKTRTGQWLDPLADKLLVLSPVVVLTALGRFPVWATVVLVVREVGIVVLRAFLGTKGRSMPASPGAKVKTTFQLLAITMYILPLGRAWRVPKLVVLVVAVVLTVVTAFDYVRQARAFLRDLGPGWARQAGDPWWRDGP